MPAISIVVPVYNAQRHLAGTLDSLLSQTFGDLEVLCVDDGSTDSSREVLERYARNDARVRVTAQPNQGVSVARNTAMAQARGDIVMFVDADDALVPDACERVRDIFAEQQPEILTFGLVCDPPEAAPASLRRELAPADRVYDGFAPDLLFKEHARPYACRSAISREFMEREQVRFEPGIALGEDQVFYFAAYPFARKTVLCSERLYIYRMNDESATHASTDGRDLLLKKLDQHLRVIEAVCGLWARRGMRDFCAAELLEWCLDFLMLDIGKLPPADQRALYARLMGCLDGFFQTRSEAHARRLPTRICLKDIRAALASQSEAPAVPKAHLSVFYLMRRGLARCLERVLMKAGVL